MSDSWENAMIDPESTLREVLESINAAGLRLVLVVDEEQNLLGTATDGDVRRALLSGLSLGAKVTEVMNSLPIVIDASASQERIIEIMKSRDLLVIPVLEGRRVVGIKTLKDMLSKPKYENPVFIMAGGFGTRLSPLTDTCPKPMLNVGGRPILDTVLRSFVKAGFVNFYISTHYMPEKIHAYFGDGSSRNINITYVHEKEPLGTGGALGLLAQKLPGNLPLIMMNGDVLTSMDFNRLLEFHTKHNADATMCVREYEYQVPYGVIQGEGLNITSMVEKPIQRFFINAGIYVVSPKIVSSVPVNHRIDMPSLLEKSIELGGSVLKFPIHEYWLDIGRMDDFSRAQVDIHTLDMD